MEQTASNLKTTAAARSLGVTRTMLFNLVHFGKITPSLRDSSGHYLWSESDLEKARMLLQVRDVGGKAPRFFRCNCGVILGRYRAGHVYAGAVCLEFDKHYQCGACNRWNKLPQDGIIGGVDK